MPTSTGAPLELNKPIAADNAETAISTYIANALQTINDAFGKLCVSVTDYGAVGDGVADDTVAIKAAIAAAAILGCAVYFPRGHYKITDVLVVPTKTRIIGAAGAYAGPGQSFGSTLWWQGDDDGYMLHLEGVRDCEIAYLGLDGGWNLGGAGTKDNIRAIYIDSDNDPVTTNLSLHHLVIRECGTGIHLADSGSGTQYQNDCISIRDCDFTEIQNAGIYTNSQNVDRLSIDSCKFITMPKGIWLARSGFTEISNCVGGTNTSDTFDFIHISGPHNNLTIRKSQAEPGSSTGSTFLRITSGASDLAHPLLLLNNNVDMVMEIAGYLPIISIANRYDQSPNLAATATDCRVTSIGDYFATGKDWTLGHASQRLWELGSLSYDVNGSHGAFGASSGNLARFKRYLTGTATVNPGSIPNAAGSYATVTVTGAAVGDTAFASFSGITNGGWLLSAHVTAANTVRVTFLNYTGSAEDLPEGTLRVSVFQH